MPRRKSSKGYRRKSTASKSKKTRSKKAEFSKRQIHSFIREMRNLNDSEE